MPDFLTPTPYEAQMMRQYGLNQNQLAWWRYKRGNARDGAAFRREYPGCLSDCFSVKTGLVYGSFNAVPLEEKGHVGRVKIGPEWKRYRAIDFGSNEQHPFVCLYIAHHAKHAPKLIIDPSCRGDGTRPGLIEEFGLYSRDPKTGKTVHMWNDGCLTYDTAVRTPAGWKPIGELAGTDGMIWTPLGWQRYENCCMTQANAEVWRLEFDDGSHVEATPDHKFLTASGFTELIDIRVGDTLRYANPESYHFGRDRADVSGEALQTMEEQAVLRPFRVAQGLDVSSSGSLGSAPRPNSGGPPHPSSRQQPQQQPHREFAAQDRARAFVDAFFNPGTPRTDTNALPLGYAAAGRQVAQIGRRQAVSQVAWKEVMGVGPVPELHMPAMRQAIQEPHETAQWQGRSKILPPELQDAGAYGKAQGGRVVVRKSQVDSSPVYDLAVPGAGCFFLKNGVVSSNCDALRYACTTFNLHGLVYVWRALYVYNGNTIGLTGCVRAMYSAEGIEIPAGAGENFAKYAARVKTRYEATVADRSRPTCISDLGRWGFQPIRGQVSHVQKFKPTTGIAPTSTDNKGAVEDGIEWIQSLITGDARHFVPEPSLVQKAQAKLALRADDGRDRAVRLTAKEEKAIAEASKRRGRSERPQEV